MDRKELYTEIKKYNLEDKIKQLYGRNYTQVSSEKLESVIECNKNLKGKIDNKETIVSKDKVTRLIEVLAKKRILLKSEVEYING